jgi:hypothetical protein
MGFNTTAGDARTSFTVPAGAGGYAPEEVYLKVLETDTPKGLYQKVRALRILIEALVATAVVEVWILRQGGDPSNAAHWFFGGAALSHNVVGLSGLFELAGINAVKLRAKSGGTAGAMPVSAWWV